MYLKRDEIAVCDVTVSRVNSKITLAAMLAHELAHSIDPCHSREFPIPKLIECLRGKNSVGALVLKPGLDCSSDQVNETFADWLAAEVVPRFIEQNYKGAGPERLRAAYVNALWRTCNQSAQMPQYPNGALRGNALLGVNPRVREQMRCTQKSQYVYCEAPSIGSAKASSSIEVTR